MQTNVFQGLIDAYGIAPSLRRSHQAVLVHRSQSGYTPRAGSLRQRVLLVFQHHGECMTIRQAATRMEEDYRRVQQSVTSLANQKVLVSCGRVVEPTPVIEKCRSFKAVSDADLSRRDPEGLPVRCYHHLLAGGHKTADLLAKEMKASVSRIHGLLQVGLGSMFEHGDDVEVTVTKKVSACLYQLKTNNNE